jgi:phosphatidylglycerol---prolipoprotein diacylglyceryl transferase
MIVVNWVQPVLIKIIPGFLEVKTWGFFLALSFIACFLFLRYSLRLKKIPAEIDAGDIVTYAIIGGLFGSKFHYLTYFIFHPSEFDLSRELANFGVGLSFQGGAFCGFLAVSIYLYRKNQSIIKFMDHCFPLIPLGYAVGKLACFFSGDGCYGSESNLPWSMSFPNGLVPTRKFRHPVPLYEFLLNFVIFLVLWHQWRHRKLIEGVHGCNAVMWLGMGRVVAEMWRGHKSVYYGLSEYQIIGILFTAGGFLGKTYLKRRNFCKKVK